VVLRGTKKCKKLKKTYFSYKLPKSCCCTHKVLNFNTLLVKGRVADIEIQKEKGDKADQESLDEEIRLARYWARDQLFNLLRNSAKGTPKAQGNSVFALVALANAVVLHENENVSGKEESAQQYVSMKHWLLKVVDTVLVVFDGNAKTLGKPFEWCQQVCDVYTLH